MNSGYRFSKRNIPPTVKSNSPPKKNTSGILSSLDSDSILILMLIFLLQKEKADKGLILALMYILT